MFKMIYANTKNSDMFYAVKMNMADPFFYINKDGQEYVFLDSREFKVFKEHNKNINIKPILLDPILNKVSKLKGNEIHNLAYFLIEKYNLAKEKVKVPNNFPLDMADFLREKGIDLRPISSFFKKRENKNSKEVEYIKDSLRRTYLAFDLIKEILNQAKMDKNKIVYRGKILTSEFLKQEVDKVLLENDMVNSESIIISSGYQTSIPHHTGKGEIKANQPIICDIFPRNRTTGYFADMTRTFVKGKPTKDFIKMYKAVLKTQLMCLDKIKAGVIAKDIHKECVRSFIDLGYQADKVGFIHGTGHGLGVEIHETPYINNFYNKKLEEGNIVTVEPGLYYPNIGGARIEDVVLVTKNGCENLTKYDKELVVFQ